MLIDTHTHVHTHTYMHTHTHKHTHTQIHTKAQTHMVNKEIHVMPTADASYGPEGHVLRTTTPSYTAELNRRQVLTTHKGKLT